METLQKTPKWLKDIQNRSWEPEILISGMTITSIFLLGPYIFNFHAALIQDFGVKEFYVRCSFNLIALAITALKISIICHLILRGIWTALIGLSYVFPKGVVKEELGKKQQKLTFYSPVELVIRLEKYCSLLFSYIFTIIYFLLLSSICYFPIILFYLFKLDDILHLHSWMVVGFFVCLFVVVGTLFEKLNAKKGNNASLRTHVNAILKTNKAKVVPMATSLIILSLLFSLPAIMAFRFENGDSVKVRAGKLTEFENEFYTQQRNNNHRLAKACLDRLFQDDSSVSLFISYYDEDKRLFKNKKNFFAANPQLNEVSSTMDLFTLFLDEEPITQENWMLGPHEKTGQKGYLASIPITSLPPGIHNIRIAKFVFQPGKDAYKLVDNWCVIPFWKR